MNSNFNRQFILTDFRLLESHDFLKFIGTREYATYLILRRYVWRSAKPHHMGLHQLYLQKRLLASSIHREKICAVTGLDPDSVTRHLRSLEQKGTIRRIATGRQSIFVLGEWIQVETANSSYREVEWFYLDGAFGIPKEALGGTGGSDPTDSVGTEPAPMPDRIRQKPADPPRRKTPGQNRRKPSDSNRESNTEIKPSVANGDLVRKLPRLDVERAQVDYLVGEILDVLGDAHSRRFYRLVASRIPQEIILEALSKIKADGANSGPKLFTHQMGRHALARLKSLSDS